jgi:hypothetical protein
MENDEKSGIERRFQHINSIITEIEESFGMFAKELQKIQATDGGMNHD